MKRITTDDPMNTWQFLNVFFCKEIVNGQEIFIRCGDESGEDISLIDWIRNAAEIHGVDGYSDGPEIVGKLVYDRMQYGWKKIEGLLGLFYDAALQAAVLRDRLKEIEDILGDDYDLEHLHELIKGSGLNQLKQQLQDAILCVGGLSMLETAIDGKMQMEKVLPIARRRLEQYKEKYLSVKAVINETKGES